MTRHWVLAAGVLLFAVGPGAQAPIPVMILDGESGGPYHDWARTTPVLKAMLDQTGRFAVTVVTAPPAGGDFSRFQPDFSRDRAIVLNYDAPDGRWPAALKAAFEAYVSGGGGVVAVHAANNAFPAWPAYNQMLGVGGWRDRTEQAGPRWYYRDGALVSDTVPGKAGSHGKRLPFVVTVRAPEHPIVKGLPLTWTHGADELYAHLRGPGTNMTVLATAYSDPANAGSGADEPQLMALTFGKGRIFHTTWGHDVAALASPDFSVTFQRGTEWAATGQVTAVALRRYQIDHGQYPVALSALMPAFMPAAPIGSLTATPSVYARRGAGFQLRAEHPKNASDVTAAALTWTVVK